MQFKEFSRQAVTVSKNWAQVSNISKVFKETQKASESFTMAALYLMARRMRLHAAAGQRRRIQERIFRVRVTLLGQTDEEIYDKYRLNAQMILDLIDELDPILQRNTCRTRAIPTHVQVLCCLHLLASGSFQGVVAVAGGVSQSSLSRFFNAFLNAMMTRINLHISFPSTPQELLNTKVDFYQIARFPHVLGCIDCTHVAICPPAENEYIFRNRKSYHSLNIQVVCNAQHIITDIVAQYPGSTHDSYIFKHSGIHTRLLRGDFGEGHLLGKHMAIFISHNVQMAMHTCH